MTALLNRLETLEADLRRERNRPEKAEASQAPALILDSLSQSLTFLAAERDHLQ